MTLVLYLRGNHATLGDTKSQTTLVGVTVCFIIFMAFELAVMLLGISLLFSQINMLQVFLHTVGCIFTTWFIIGNWPADSMWPIWGCFGVAPFVLEVCIVAGAVIFSSNINKNRLGQFKQ